MYADKCEWMRGVLEGGICVDGGDGCNKEGRLKRAHAQLHLERRVLSYLRLNASRLESMSHVAIRSAMMHECSCRSLVAVLVGWRS